MNEINVNVSAKLIDGYEFYCVKCGNDNTEEEHEKFLNDIYSNNHIVLNEDFVVDDKHICKKCGCNLFRFIGNIEMVFNDDINKNISITKTENDSITEIVNILMGTASNTLFCLLGEKVTITVEKILDDIADIKYEYPCVGCCVNYIENINDTSILIFNGNDVKIITNLMMGGDGEIDYDDTITELDLSAVGEAINQMMGASTILLSSLIKKRIDIKTPCLQIQENNDDVFKLINSLKSNDLIYVVLKLKIGNLIDSKIIQVMPKSFMEYIVNNIN